VYTYTMSRRTQITFTDRQHALLLYESNRSGLSMAELVRRAVDRTFRPVSRRPSVRGFEVSPMGLSNVSLERVWLDDAGDAR